MAQPGFFDMSNRLSTLSSWGDSLEHIGKHVDFEVFRPLLTQHLSFSCNETKGGRPSFDSVLMFKILILQTLYNISDDQTEYQIHDRFSFMRFLNLTLADKIPDAKTIWLYRERLKPIINQLFQQFNDALKAQGYIAMSGQIVDASVIKAPRQRFKEEEKEAIRQGKKAGDIWENPHKASQKDTDARWRVKQAKAKKKGQVSLAIPEFGYKNHLSIDKAYGFVRRFCVTHAAHFDGHELENLLDKDNTCSKVWADTAYSNQDNQLMLKEKGYVCDIHQRKSRKHNTKRLFKSNTRRSKIRAHVEHVFAGLKYRMGLFIRTIGLARATVKIGLANLVYNMQRYVFHERKQITTG